MRIRPEPPEGEVAIEFAAQPRRRVCPQCAGEGKDFKGLACELCSGLGLLMPPHTPFDLEVSRSIGKFKSAPWVITLDDHPYAGFVNETSAVEAAKLFLGYHDGLGRVVSDRQGVHWPGCEGRVVRVVRQGYRRDDNE